MSARWGSYLRPTGTQYGCERVLCADHAPFDPDGFAARVADDPPGDRCTAPRIGAPCIVCGTDT